MLVTGHELGQKWHRESGCKKSSRQIYHNGGAFYTAKVKSREIYASFSIQGKIEKRFMDHKDGDVFSQSGEATGGEGSDEEIEVTAAEVLAQLEEVCMSVVRMSVVCLLFFTLNLTTYDLIVFTTILLTLCSSMCRVL